MYQSHQTKKSRASVLEKNRIAAGRQTNSNQFTDFIPIVDDPECLLALAVVSVCGYFAAEEIAAESPCEEELP